MIFGTTDEPHLSIVAYLVYIKPWSTKIGNDIDIHFRFSHIIWKN